MTDLMQPAMTPMRVEPVTEEVKDFSKSSALIKFTMDGDEFIAPARIPAQTLIDFTKMLDNGGAERTLEQTIETFKATIRLVLMPESAALFESRMADASNPIDFEQINQVVPWLMEKYGLRPTEPSENSSDGQVSQESGTPSTETPPVEASISLPSPPTDSST